MRDIGVRCIWSRNVILHSCTCVRFHIVEDKTNLRANYAPQETISVLCTLSSLITVSRPVQNICIKSYLKPIGVANIKSFAGAPANNYGFSAFYADSETIFSILFAI